MMFQNTGIRILKKSVNMTGIEQRIQKEKKQRNKSPPNGEKQMFAELRLITQLPERLEKVVLYAVPAFDVEKKSHLHITKITTNLWMLFGYVNHAINSVTKNLKDLFKP